MPPATASNFSIRRRRAEPRKSSPSPGRAAAMPTASPRRMSSDRPCLPHHEIDAAVLRLALIGIIAGNRLRAAVADRRETVRGQPCLDQIIGDRLRALLRECLVGWLL